MGKSCAAASGCDDPCLALCAAAIVAALLLACPAVAACPTAGDQRAEVTGVSERGEIQLADGRQARLAGLDVPDPGRGDPKTARAALQWLNARLVHQQIGLRLLAPRPDRWGRLLADIFVSENSAPPASVALGLLAAGLARVRPEAEASDCLAVRLAAERAARANGLGLWTDPYYGVAPATLPTNLRQRDGEFVVIEGVVDRVGQSRSRIYLDFGRRGGFTAMASTRQAPAFERAGIVLTALTGARVRVRGVMDERFGLRMTLNGPDQIERVTDGAETNGVKADK